MNAGARWTLRRASLAGLAGVAGVATLLLAVPAVAGAQVTERLHVALVGQSARVRTTRLEAVTPERDVALRGIDAEFWLRKRTLGATGASTRDGLGVAVRLHQSTLGTNDLMYHDISALYGLGGLIQRIAGARVRDAAGDIAVEVAVGSHAGFETSSGLAHGEMHQVARAGVRASTRLAPAPLSLELRMSRFIPLGGPSGEDGLGGFEGETALRWSFTRLPFDAAVGYRFQRMRVYRAAQEATALRLEVGWRGFR